MVAELHFSDQQWSGSGLDQDWQLRVEAVIATITTGVVVGAAEKPLSPPASSAPAEVKNAVNPELHRWQLSKSDDKC